MATCAVCAKSSARMGNILCGDCSRAYMVMLELLYQHPELARGDLVRIKEVFEWQWQQWRALKTRPAQPEGEVSLLPER
jgi:hypothetical protein